MNSPSNLCKRVGFAVVALSAAMCMPALQAAQVIVGQVGPMSGLDASQGRGYSTGMQLAFDAVNKAGGVNGHTFKLVRRDDGGRPQDTLAQTKAMLTEDKPTVLAGFFGSGNLAGLVQSGLLDKDRIALVGIRTTELRPDAPLVYNVRATLRDELNKLVTHVTTIGMTRVGLFYENDAGAPALLAAAEEAAKGAGATISHKASYEAGTAKVTAAVDTFTKGQPQAILLVASGAAAAAFIEQFRGAGGTAQLFAHSGADIEQLAKRLSEEQMQGVAIAQVTPSPYRISSRLAKELNDLAKAGAAGTPISYSMMEGFIAAKVIVEAVRRQGARPSRETMPAALESMEAFDMGGYMIGFKPNMRNGSRFVELSIISGSGRIRQ